MKYIDEYRDKKLIDFLVKKIHLVSKRNIRLMEVCGGHTNAIQKFGMPSLLPETIELLSGPGCPVCVTAKQYIDKAIYLSNNPSVIITTYGDLIRVPGSSSSLEREKAKGADVRIVFSALDSFQIAEKNPNKKIVFLGIGFETTSPATAVTIMEAKKRGVRNYFLLNAHKVMPPAMEALIREGITLNGYICPGHVSTITGIDMYKPIVRDYKVGCVITGFEPTDILQSILMLADQFERGEPKLEIQYKRAVRADGNKIALKLMNDIFELKDDNWRGIGIIPQSGFQLKESFVEFDAEKYFTINIPPSKEEKGCICGEILKGLKKPVDCTLFRKVCNPVNPVGACMVSAEGACQAYYRYN